MIYYTTEEGGNIQELLIKSMHQKIARQLYKNKTKIDGKFCSYIGKIKVHSVFFVRNERVKKIWDSNRGKYIAKIFLKNIGIKNGKFYLRLIY